jgi:hypothetical protein
VADRLGSREVEDVRAEHLREPGRVDGDLSRVRRAEEEDVLAGQVEVPGCGGFLDQVPEPVDTAPLVGVLGNEPAERDDRAAAAMSPSPVQSTVTRAETTTGPDLVSNTTSPARPGARTPLAKECSR